MKAGFKDALFAMPNSTIGLILHSGNGEAEITFRFLPTKAAWLPE